jgi:hypothetical protein
MTNNNDKLQLTLVINVFHSEWQAWGLVIWSEPARVPEPARLSGPSVIALFMRIYFCKYDFLDQFRS